MNYEKQAENFLKSCNVAFRAEKAVPQTVPRWAKDGNHGTKYSITLYKIRDNRDTRFESIETLERISERYIQFFFWNSIHAKMAKSDKPSVYHVLAGVYFPCSDFEDFCTNFGYSEDSIEALSTYNEVVEQNKKIESIFSEKELEKLQGIQ